MRFLKIMILELSFIFFIVGLIHSIEFNNIPTIIASIIGMGAIIGLTVDDLEEA